MVHSGIFRPESARRTERSGPGHAPWPVRKNAGKSPLPWRAGQRDTMGIQHSKEEHMEASPSSAPGLKRSLSVWAAVGLSVALMAPSMAANINPQASATTAGRAVPLTFLIAAVGVLLVAYSFVRLCQYFHQ